MVYPTVSQYGQHDPHHDMTATTYIYHTLYQVRSVPRIPLRKYVALHIMLTADTILL